MTTILHKLRAEPGKIGKEVILRKANTFDKEMFKLAYDMSKMYNLKFNHISWSTVNSLHDMDKILLNNLANRSVTGTAARELVESHCKQYGDLVKLICNKDLDCGVSATTLNKVFGKGFVSVFEVQLATEVAIADVTLPIAGQIKYNGVRVIAIIEDKGVTFKTRNGKEFKFPFLAERLAPLRQAVPYDFILDGELAIGDSKGTNHTDVSGIVNSAIKGTPISGIFHPNLVFNCFDFLPLKEFYAQECTHVYAARFAQVRNMLMALYCINSEHEKYVKIAETYEFNTREAIQAKFEEVLANGYEGLILKKWSHKYTYKRSKDWIKLKAVDTADLVCVSIEEGTGKYEGMIGALVCEGLVKDHWVRVSVGSGLTDNDRDKRAIDYLYHKIEIKYNTIIQDRVTEEYSLFLPRFVTIRGDL
jgi:DNA ligase-1